jgi:hypothetical protein
VKCVWCSSPIPRRRLAMSDVDRRYCSSSCKNDHVTEVMSGRNDAPPPEDDGNGWDVLAFLGQKLVDRAADRLGAWAKKHGIGQVPGAFDESAPPPPPPPQQQKPQSFTPEEMTDEALLKVLGLPVNSDLKDCEEAYRFFAKKWHPDKGVPEGERKLKVLNAVIAELRRRKGG